MANKIKKAQVVLTVVDEASHSFHFLLMQTNERRGSFWQNVTGKLDEGETYEEGGLREAIEETGLNLESIVDIINLNLGYDFIDQRERDVHEESFLMILEEKWDVKIDPHEHQGYKWVPMKDMQRDLVKYESNYEALSKAMNLLKKWGN